MAIRWRDNASPQAQDDIDTLFADCLDLVRRNLTEDRGFDPFAAVISETGARNIRLAPTVAATKTAIHQALTTAADRTESRAVAIAMDVTTPDGGDAAELLIEHAEGIAIQIIIPYTTTPQVALATDHSTTALAERRIWGLRL
ncbi:hypothetical protein [Nocardia testacea]|uniref:hypothetical protein n=1 Tax=Nocardia testacea TaxID=248551 RepID=UPI003A83CBC2